MYVVSSFNAKKKASDPFPKLRLRRQVDDRIRHQIQTSKHDIDNSHTDIVTHNDQPDQHSWCEKYHRPYVKHGHIVDALFQSSQPSYDLQFAPEQLSLVIKLSYVLLPYTIYSGAYRQDDDNCQKA